MRAKRKRWSRSSRRHSSDFDDYLESMNQMKNMGGIAKYPEHDARYRRQHR